MPFGFIVRLVPHLPAGTFNTITRCILTDEFSPVRRARSILTIPEVLTKSHLVAPRASALRHRLIYYLKVSRWAIVILHTSWKVLVWHEIDVCNS